MLTAFSESSHLITFRKNLSSLFILSVNYLGQLGFWLSRPTQQNLVYILFNDTVLEMEILFIPSPHPSFYCFIFKIVIFLFILYDHGESVAVCGLSVAMSRTTLVAMHGLLLAVISLVVKHRLQACGLH